MTWVLMIPGLVLALWGGLGPWVVAWCDWYRGPAFVFVGLGLAAMHAGRIRPYRTDEHALSLMGLLLLSVPMTTLGFLSWPVAYAVATVPWIALVISDRRRMRRQVGRRLDAAAPRLAFQAVAAPVAFVFVLVFPPFVRLLPILIVPPILFWAMLDERFAWARWGRERSARRLAELATSPPLVQRAPLRAPTIPGPLVSPRRTRRRRFTSTNSWLGVFLLGAIVLAVFFSLSRCGPNALRESAARHDRGGAVGHAHPGPATHVGCLPLRVPDPPRPARVS